MLFKPVKCRLIHDPLEQMNDKQLALLKQLLWSVANDPVAIADMDSYGKAHQQLSQLLADHQVEQLSLSPAQLHPAK